MMDMLKFLPENAPHSHKQAKLFNLMPEWLGGLLTLRQVEVNNSTSKVPILFEI